MRDNFKTFPDDLQRCIQFHGHLCPGLVYGYLVAKEAVELLMINRAGDEEIVAVSENDSCAVDALQVILGTTIGKGNLIIKNYGKNVFVIFERKNKTAFRFSKKQQYVYKGDNEEEFENIDKAVSSGTATQDEKRRQKYLKALDLLTRKFSEVFETEKAAIPEPAYAELASSMPCAECGELTMSSKMIKTDDGGFICIPCHERLRIPHN